MAKKVNGYSHKHSMRGEWFFNEHPHETRIGGLQKDCTLIVHEGRHERVFTESEVRAIIEELARETYVWTEWKKRHAKRLLSEYGIDLNKA